MNRLYIGIILCLIFINLSAQEVSEAVSKSGYVSITKDPPKPPFLVIDETTLKFTDADDNLKLNANEGAYISFTLLNKGQGPGLNLKVSMLESNKIPSIKYSEVTDIGKLEVNESRLVKIPLTAGMELADDQAKFIIKIDEANGFDSDPVQIVFETVAFRSPLIKVVDYKVISESSSTLNKRKPFDLQVLIQNVGKGKAQNISIKVQVPEGVFCLSDNVYTLVDKLESGEQYLAEYTFVANNEYNQNTIPLFIELTERYIQYAENMVIELTMNQNVSNTKLVVEGKTELINAFVIGSLSSSVDKNLPITDFKKPDRIALVIGNENYSGTLNAEINVDFARNDAEIFKRYCLNILGVEEKNMFFLMDATAGQMRKEIDRVTELMKRLGERGELIFYYAGHGFPDEVSKTPYLIPVDVDATNLSMAIKLSEIYKKFGSTEASKITIFLDACFSGGGRTQGLLAARGVVIKPMQETLSGNMVVFSATSGVQSALPYYKEQHGMFTFFLLKKLQESHGEISYDDLAAYLLTEVGIESLRENGKPQDPEINTSHAVASDWGKWNFR